jgi:hypothetical protein
MFSSPVQPGLHFSQVGKIFEIFGGALTGANLLILLAIVPIGRAQTADPANWIRRPLVQTSYLNFLCT